MPRLGRRKPQLPESIGSLMDDVRRIARNIIAATAEGDVMIWVSAGAEVFCAPIDTAPDVLAEYVLGVYAMGAKTIDVEEDLQALRNARVSRSILF